jgi:hypothetical protein
MLAPRDTATRERKSLTACGGSCPTLTGRATIGAGRTDCLPGVRDAGAGQLQRHLPRTGLRGHVGDVWYETVA